MTVDHISANVAQKHGNTCITETTELPHITLLYNHFLNGWHICLYVLLGPLVLLSAASILQFTKLCVYTING